MIIVLFHAFLQFFKLHILTFLFNHLLNIPLSIMLGVGKYGSFVIALVIDIAQMVVYYNVLNNTALGKKFGWAIDSKLLKNYKKPEFMSKWHDSSLYIGVLILSMLPIYFGGIFAAVFTAHVLKLNKVKSFVFAAAGSVIGCFVWTIGVWNLIALIFGLFHHH